MKKIKFVFFKIIKIMSAILMPFIMIYLLALDSAKDNINMLRKNDIIINSK